MTLRKYIALFAGRVPIYSQSDNDAKYGGHALAYGAALAVVTLVAQYNFPLGTAGKITCAILELCAVFGLMRSLYEMKKAVGG
jgi:hypothetical protein